jgi:predicted ribosome quality control (RQC) complex YloA/Tae2 family protein
MNDAVLAFFLRARQEADRVARLRSRLSSIAAALKRSERLKANLQADLERSQLAENYKVYAGLLYAQPDRSPKGITGLKVINLFDPELPEIEIPLDPQYSLVQNANRYSKLHQKANRSIPLIEKRIARLQTEMHALRTEKQEITSQSGSAGSVGVTGTSEQQVDREPHLARRSRSERISERPGKSGIRNAAAFNPQSQLRKVAKSFVSSEGLQILVGRTSKGNDILTQQIARSEDFWLHVAGYGGSHVVLRNPEKLSVAPRKSLVEAAQLAAYFSQARNAAKVEVHYTQKRFVSKPKGAKPGMVRLKEFKSISARPCLLDETAQW